MNVAAPLAAAALARMIFVAPERAAGLWAAAAMQTLLLLGWHVPASQGLAMQSHGLQIVMHASLFVSALWFWWVLLRLPAKASWQAIAALLLTGKLACLLAALLIFAPRVLYKMPPVSLDDQQLAGLLMVVACPLSYVVAGVVIAAQVLSHLDERSGRPQRRALSPIR
jgi:putative membrane protein